MIEKYNILREKYKEKNKNINIFDATNKKCSACNSFKLRLEQNWHKDNTTKDGLRCYCKECMRIKNNQRRKEFLHKNKNQNPFNGTLKSCPECRKEKRRLKENWHKDLYAKDGLYRICSICRSFQKKKRKYNLSKEEYNFILGRQKNRCKICGINLKNNINIDHNHKTGKIRGILCNNCNRALGYFKDNPMILYKAINYLRGNL